MAILTNPLHLKYGDIVYECLCYTTQDEATPMTIPGGSCWELRNNNTVCYVGLWPTSVSGGVYHTPLKTRKGGIEYYVETQVVNTFEVTIVQSANQTITVTCNGIVYTSSFTAPAGGAYSVTVTPVTGYTAGSPSSSSGYVNSNLTITASAASKKTYLVTITQSSNQTIKVVCDGTTYTSSFTANHGDTWTATVTPSTGYNAGTLSATGGTVTGAVTIKASAATIKTFTVTITQSSNQTIKVVCGGTTYTSSFTANYGATWTATVTPSNGYKAGTLSPGSSGTVTTAVAIKASAAVSRDGEQIASNTASFKVPTGVSYVSINAVYQKIVTTTSGSSKSSTTTSSTIIGCCVRRVSVISGTTYTLNTFTGENSGYDYMAGFNCYMAHSTLGNVPFYGSTSATNLTRSTTHFAIYVDDGTGTPFTDSTVRSTYTSITGGSIPS